MFVRHLNNTISNYHPPGKSYSLFHVATLTQFEITPEVNAPLTGGQLNLTYGTSFCKISCCYYVFPLVLEFDSETLFSCCFLCLSYPIVNNYVRSRVTM